MFLEDNKVGFGGEVSKTTYRELVVNFVNFILEEAVGTLRVAGTEVNAKIVRKENRVKFRVSLHRT